MSGHRSFDTLRSRMSPERRQRNRLAGEVLADEVLADEVTQRELRAARQETQKDDTAAMSVLHPAVAALERRGDMSVSDLASSVAALGGRLVITAEFPEQSVTLRLGIREEGISSEGPGESP